MCLGTPKKCVLSTVLKLCCCGRSTSDPGGEQTAISRPSDQRQHRSNGRTHCGSVVRQRADGNWRNEDDSDCNIQCWRISSHYRAIWLATHHGICVLSHWRPGTFRHCTCQGHRLFCELCLNTYSFGSFRLGKLPKHTRINGGNNEKSHDDYDDNDNNNIQHI